MRANPEIISPETVKEIENVLRGIGITEADWNLFLKCVKEVAPGTDLNKAQYLIISLLDDRSRDGRISRVTTKGKWGGKFKAWLIRDIRKLRQVAVKMGDRNFLNIDGYWDPLLEDIATKTGLEAFGKYITRPKDPRWKKVEAPKVAVWAEVLQPTGAPPPTPTPPTPAPPPPAPPTPVPPITAAAPTTPGLCSAGDKTLLIKIDKTIEKMNKDLGTIWHEMMEVEILNIVDINDHYWAHIKDAAGYHISVPVDYLRCYLTAPGEAPPVTVPEEKPEKKKPKAKAELPEELKPIDHMFPADSPTAQKISTLLKEIASRFMFEDESDALIFFSTWFMRDGSCLLKGAPGSGKTVLLTLAAMSMSGEEWRNDPKVKSVDSLLDWMRNHDIFGMTQYNADKEPEDVFFYTDISIDKVEIKKEGEPDRERSRYIFKPTPRPIVSSFVKLHNESNRLGPNTADALLGLLAEKRVEYKGMFFTSPRVPQKIDDPPPEDRTEWESWQKRSLLPDADPLKLDVGHLNFFDYNPHLDTEGMEMDRALLDRIEVGIYLSAGGLSTRYRILKKQAIKGKVANIPKAYFIDMSAKDSPIHPLTPDEIMSLWKIVEQIPIDDEALRWIAFFTNLPNFTVRQFKTGSYFKLEEKKGRKEKVPKSVPKTGFIDPTVISYKGSKAQMTLAETPMVVGTDQIEPSSTIDALNRPLGSRAELSLRNLLKAAIFVEYVRGKTPHLHFIVNDTSIEEEKRDDYRRKQVSHILAFLPYVLDHRVNIGVGPDIQTNFLNFAHYIEYYFKPQIFYNERNFNRWMAAMKIMGEIPNGMKKSVIQLRDEWAVKWIAEMVKQGESEEDLKKSLEEDPFIVQLYNLAGTTID